MDLVLELLDTYVLDHIYSSILPSHTLGPFLALHSPSLILNQASAGSAIPQAIISSAASAAVARPSLEAFSELAKNSSAAAVRASTAFNLNFSSGASLLPRDNIIRQAISLFVITHIGIHLLYFASAAVSYWLIFDHNMKRHPQFLPNQIRREINASLSAFPYMNLMTLPWFVADVRGYSQLYFDKPTTAYDFGYMAFSALCFLLFTDFGVYWIHRTLHHPLLYKTFHKPHHTWKIPSPFASHAFHPVDGYLQSVPYHVFAFLFPLHKYLYLSLFIAVNCWSIFIHDSEMISGNVFESIINGPSHHTLHHLLSTVNYGQYFTFSDMAFGSYRAPAKELDPALEIKMNDKRLKEKKDAAEQVKLNSHQKVE